MEEAALALVMLAVFGWGLGSARLGRADLTAPVVFVAIGLLLARGLHLDEPDAAGGTVRILAEVTLVWFLFADASRVGPREIRADLGVQARLLGVGLPLTIAAGTLLAMWLFGGMGVWLALLVGAALAPTDAALASVVMSDPTVPERVRRVLNVESGLNDGIVTPVVTYAIAAAATAASAHGHALVGILIGVAAGIVAGLAGGHAMRAARHRGWVAAAFEGPAVLALALATYTGTIWLGGNGFVAAFVAGLAFGHAAGRGGTREIFYVEQTAGLVSLLTWLLFGAVVVPVVLENAGWAMLGYAVLSLTVIRMAPVALALLGAGLPARTVAFIGWFGPRGLASIIFALIALDDLRGEAVDAVAIIGITVVLSVFAHGLSAKPLAKRYAASQPPAAAKEAR
ncbi:cation:proton antiporter [Actinoplanes sp. NPDC051513]|uniref:cation:proton antiporter n=1 Tax=Actinoplanes sp. NPDC051513 TaxID=3363908 RepID=UPI0037B04C20